MKTLAEYDPLPVGAMMLGLGILCLLLMAPLVVFASDGKKADTGRVMNRLQFETSPYLLQHAGNPVDWYPWGEEAFARARKENKPIFLSVGYSTCYWCQVMEHESFENSFTAGILNRGFVSIKVDREERPDIDQIYMSAVQLLSGGGGGWPMSVFLTPELKPFHGGTYIPNSQFNQILEQLAALWSTQQQNLQKRADEVTARLQSTGSMQGSRTGSLPAESLAADGVKRFAEIFDAEAGGFGGAPKFPRPAVLELLLKDYEVNGNRASLDMVSKTLDAMARGGIYDQLAGGFHRYSTDSHWLVPHFEKMLYDNAQLLKVYAHAYQLTGNADFRRTSEDIVAYVQREMTSNEGLFYSAQDSGVEGEEGRSYIWQREDLRKLLTPKEFSLAAKVYGFDAEPNFEGQYILYRPWSYQQIQQDTALEREPLLAQLDRIRSRLRKARQSQEPQPLQDDKIITAWNGLMIEALAYAGQVLHRSDFTRMAERAARQVLSLLQTRQGELLHVLRLGQSKLPAYLDDYAAMILALTELSKPDGGQLWQAEAIRLADMMIEKFWDQTGGFHFAQQSVEHLLIRPKSSFDGAIPAANSLAAQALTRLAKKHPAAYSRYAEQTMRAFGPHLKRAPHALPYMLVALIDYNRLSSPASATEGGTTGPLQVHTSDVLRMQASLSPERLVSGRTTRLEVQLDMDTGWHLVSNPASLDFLLPTSVEAQIIGGELRLRPDYPIGYQVDSPLGKLGLYKEQVQILSELTPVQLPGEREAQLEVRVKAQACNDTGRCLLPSTLTQTIAVEIGYAE